MTFDLDRHVRRNIRKLKPYSSARSEFAGSAEVFLDANENAFGSAAGSGFNRYPDPLQTDLKRRIAPIKGVGISQIFIGNGSDEAIDLLFRIFCEPGRDKVIICPPTYGMYRVSADINDVAVCEVPLTNEFELDVPGVMSGVNENTKLIFICSPNNPTGNLMQRGSIIEIAENFDGIVIVDEAYIDYSGASSMTAELSRLPNLVVLQTFSKAWGMAALRVGLAFASDSIIDLMNRVKPPYNVSGIAQSEAVVALDRAETIGDWVASTLAHRAELQKKLLEISFVEKIYPSDANFILVKVKNADAVYQFLLKKKIVVRNRSNVELCKGCLRITIGTVEEISRLVDSLREFDRISGVAGVPKIENVTI